jgi:hypothetical protein
MIMIEIIIHRNVVRLIKKKNPKFSKTILLARTSRIDDVSSQRRSHSTTGIIDEKSPRIDNGSYNVAPKAPSDAGSDTKKRSRSFVRPIIRSAVPNSQITTIIKRPSQSGRGIFLPPPFKSLSFSFLSFSWSTS